MDTLKLPKNEALKAYEDGSSEDKQLLERLFPSVFKPLDIVERINFFSDICDLNGTTEEAFFKECADCRLRPHEIANRQREMICVAYNQGWLPDYNNSSEEKWELWFLMNEPGFRLYAAGFAYTDSTVGARLVFKSREHALDAAKKFLPIYETAFTFKAETTTAVQPAEVDSSDPFVRDCKKLGYNPLTVVPDLSLTPEKYQAAIRSFIRLLVGADAKREGHVFDYQDNDEEKWYPWWDLEVDENNPSGFRLDGADCDGTYSIVGARLSLRTEKEVREMAEEYKDDYRNVMKQ